MAGMGKEDFETASREIMAAWNAAETRDAGFKVILDFGRKYGYKNVMAAIQGRMPKRFEDGQDLASWIEERHREETTD
jgi:hypothetical protein